MSIKAIDLLEQVITPTLLALGMYSVAAEKLLLGTAAQQSGFDPFSQSRNGIGLYQISTQQHHSAWDQYLAFRPDLASSVRGLASQRQFLEDPDRELKTNLAYSTAIAWIIYLQTEQQLPEAEDLEGLGYFWKRAFSAGPESTGEIQQFALWFEGNPLAA